MSTDIQPDDPEALESFCKVYLQEAIDAALTGDTDAIEVSFRDLGTDPDVREYYEAVQHGNFAEVCDHIHDAATKVATHPTELQGTAVRIVDIPDYVTEGPDTLWQSDAGDFVAVEGQVAKSSAVDHEPQELAWECQRCGTLTLVPVVGDMQEPRECNGCEREGPFVANHSESTFEPYQLVRVEQPPEKAANGNGDHIDIEVRNDLVNQALAGDRVTFVGHYELEQKEDLFEGYVNAHSVEHDEHDYDEIDIDQHREEIQEIAAGEYGDPFDLLIDSIAPKIHGYDTIKEAVALQLFGGVRSEYPDGSNDRGDIHMLLLGDPGCGKSSILRAVEEISPRSVYASGKGATEAGMTAAVTFDDFGDTPASLEAGALVTANSGIACVDELDKVPETVVSSMHDALESQRVQINKGGINATLPAETAMLAAGNPKHGRFDDMDPIYEQIDLGPTLMSRFDLMWMVDDQPDQERDREIASHMVRARQTANLHASDEHVDEDQLETIQPAIPADLLRAYIAHAKRTVTPRIEDSDLGESLVESFGDLRQVNGDNGPVPVTFRKLEGIQRLAEASARVRLSETVEAEDVERAKRLIGESMAQLQKNEDDQMDADIIEAGRSLPQQKRMDITMDSVRDMEQNTENGVRKGDLLDELQEQGIDRDRAKKDLKLLETNGRIYQPSSGCYRTT